MDYKKKLKEYRKSIKTNDLKTVEFKEPNSHYINDTDLTSLESQLKTYHYQPSQLNESEPILKILRNAPREFSFSKTPSPQPQPEFLLTSTLIKETGLQSEHAGRYINWNSKHALLTSHPWCCIGDLMGFCDKYEFKPIIVSDVHTHSNIVSDVKALLSGKPPFDVNRRFPDNIRNEANLQVCIGRCPSIEYHLQRIINIFRRPLSKLSTEKQNMAKQNFHIAIRELHFDISARITEVKLYDRAVFEKEFNLKWQNSL